MTRKYNKIEINALQQLADFNDIFYPSLVIDDTLIRKTKNPEGKLVESADAFIDIFCQNNFADTDYSIMQSEPRDYETAQKWIDQISIDTVLKCLTYIIWNNKIDNGYFIKKIEDGLVKRHLGRLQNILKENKLPSNQHTKPITA